MAISASGKVPSLGPSSKMPIVTIERVAFWFSISATGELLPDRALTRISVDTMESAAFLVRRLLSDPMISVSEAVLSHKASKETPIATTEASLYWFDGCTSIC